jgi:Na+/phosphate symporter
MKDKRIVVNPFRMISRRLDGEAVRLEKLHEQPFSESLDLEEGLLVMISKVIVITELLSKCVFSESETQMDRAASLAKEVHDQEKALTLHLTTAGIAPDLLKGIIRFPFRLERTGDMLESILNCCRIKASQGILFSDKAQEELNQLFRVLLSVLNNLRDAFVTPNKFLLEHILSDVKTMGQMLQDFRLAHWDRLAAGFCSPRASSIYLDILDSTRSINEYIEKMSLTLLELGGTAPVVEQVGSE